MRAAPAIHVFLQRFGVWQAAVGVAAVLGLGTMALWLLARVERPGVPTVLLASLASFLTVAFAVSLWRIAPAWLRWDGRGWSLAHGQSAPAPGDIAVAIDLGSWMLLRFVPEGRQGVGASVRTVWLPVQRRGLEPQWHGLRAAVYSPRLAAIDAAPQGR